MIRDSFSGTAGKRGLKIRKINSCVPCGSFIKSCRVEYFSYYLYSLNPVGERPKCFILVRTRALSSCLSERLKSVSLCWLILSVALPGPPLAALEPRPPFLLRRRAHCMLFLLSSGWSEECEEVEMGSEEVELRWAPDRDSSGSLGSRVSS